MAVTIKYKDLTRRLMIHMSINELVAVRDQLIEEFNRLTDEHWETRRTKKELMAQIGLISGVIDEKFKKVEYHCEKCGELTTFSGNMCECCFDAEVDRYYDGGRDEDE